MGIYTHAIDGAAATMVAQEVDKHTAMVSVTLTPSPGQGKRGTHPMHMYMHTKDWREGGRSFLTSG